MKRTYKYNRCGGVSKGRQNACVRQNLLFIIKIKLYVLYILYIYIYIYIYTCIYCVYTKTEFGVLAVGMVAIRGFGQGMGVGIWQPHPIS